jgi:hypothetical protein
VLRRAVADHRNAQHTGASLVELYNTTSLSKRAGPSPGLTDPRREALPESTAAARQVRSGVEWRGEERRGERERERERERDERERVRERDSREREREREKTIS